jgi:hypothetical protein
MILLRILEHDLHRARQGVNAVPLMIEVPAKESFLPALVSNGSGKFLVSRRLTQEGRIRVGVFSHDSDRVDDVITTIADSALELSRAENWPNIFQGKGSAEAAFNYIRKESGFNGQPHVCLMPDTWDEVVIRKWLGAKNVDGRKYKKYCHIVPSKVSFPVFCSRPDMVGMYTQFMGGRSSILLHNVKFGFGLCPMPS